MVIIYIVFYYVNYFLMLFFSRSQAPAWERQCLKAPAFRQQSLLTRTKAPAL